MILHSIPHLAAAVIITNLGVFTYLKNQKSPINLQFALFCIMVSLWYGGLSIALNSADLPAYFFWQKDKAKEWRRQFLNVNFQLAKAPS
mgnify:CR=1 FL=1